MKYVLDTSLINKLVDGSVMPTELPSDGPLIASNIQVAEIERTRNTERRDKLLSVLAAISHENIQIGGSSNESQIVTSIRAELDGRNKRKASNTNDALLAEFAMTGGHVLLTADLDLYEVAYRRGIGVIYWSTQQCAAADRRENAAPAER